MVGIKDLVRNLGTIVQDYILPELQRANIQFNAVPNSDRANLRIQTDHLGILDVTFTSDPKISIERLHYHLNNKSYRYPS